MSCKDSVLKFLKRDYSTNAWAVLKSFGYSDIVNHFATSDKVHSLENMMVMLHVLRSHFDTLDLWFEPVEVCLRLIASIPSLTRRLLGCPK